MAISASFQRELYASHADVADFVRTLDEAEARKAELRATGLYRRVSHVRWNYGSRERPIWMYKVLAWRR